METLLVPNYRQQLKKEKKTAIPSGAVFMVTGRDDSIVITLLI